MTEKEINLIRKKAMQDKYHSIFSHTTYVDGKRYYFGEQKIYGDKLLVFLPGNFIDMPQNLAKVKYPSEQRPRVIKTSTDTSVNFAFSYFPQKIEDTELTKFRNGVRDVIKKMNPHNDFLGEGVTEIKGEPLGICSWFEYTSPTIDSAVYNFNAFLRIDGKLLNYIFNCDKKHYEAWRDVAHEVAQSIRANPEI